MSPEEDSFDYGIAVLEEQADQTIVQAAVSTRFDRFMGPSTRVRVVSYVMGHTWDIHGREHPPASGTKR
jgi:hypothetical protein